MSLFTLRIKKLRQRYELLNSQKDLIENIISKHEEDINNIKKQMEVCDKTALFINAISTDAKTKVISVLEDMVTDALKSISDRDYKFRIIIEETPKGSKCDFYISEMVNGEESLQRPQDSCGGGFVDIISTTLRYVYLNVFSEPNIKGPIVLDEPAKMLSSDMADNYAEFVKKLGEDFDRQTIMVTHNDTIKSYGDNNIEIRKI